MAAATNQEARQNIMEGWQDDNIAKKYSRAEQATGPFSDVMVKRSGLASLDGEANIFDLACGTGAVEAAIYRAVPQDKWGNVKILGGDISEPMLKYLEERAKKEGWPGVETKIVDGFKEIELPASSYTHAFVGFAIFVLPLTTLPTLFKLLQPGGFVAVNNWSYFPWSRFAARAMARIPDSPAYPDELAIEARIHGDKPWHMPEFVTKTLEDAGFVDVQVSEEQFDCEVGTPEELLEVLHMPLSLVASFWEESSRQHWLDLLKKEMLVLGREEAGGDGKSMVMTWKALTGTGRKPF